MPKPDKNDASNGLILGHEVLRKCSNFFQKEFKLGLDPKIEFEKGSIPRYHQTFPGEPGASEQQPKRETTCLLLPYGFELRAGHIWWLE